MIWQPAVGGMLRPVLSLSCRPMFVDRPPGTV